jgi:hypothetical protein
MSTTLLRLDEKKISEGDSLDEKLSDEGISVEGDIPKLGVPLYSDDRGAKAFPSFWRREKVDLDAIATQPSVFDNPVSLEAYRPPPVYENVHRFDPKARWTWREERVRDILFVHLIGYSCVRCCPLESRSQD